MKTVQLLGQAPNLVNTPTIPGVERWCSGAPRSYRIKWREAKETWTRWFNVHTARHIQLCYPHSHAWLGTHDGSRPVYLQEADPNIPGSVAFPKDAIQAYFNSSYFTGTVTWLTAFAIMEGFERIEYWGFELKKDRNYDFERPCLSYWVEVARSKGIEIVIPTDLDGVQIEFGPPGNPDEYDGPLYGYEPHNPIYAKTF